MHLQTNGNKLGGEFFQGLAQRGQGAIDIDDTALEQRIGNRYVNELKEALAAVG